MKNFDDMGIIEMAKTLGDMGKELEIKTRTTHTPTPWSVGSFGTIISGRECTTDGGDLPTGKLIAKVEDWRNNQANAAFIVRAVNSHEEFLQIAKDALSLVLLASYPNEQKDSQIIKRIKEAIAKAEGGR